MLEQLKSDMIRIANHDLRNPLSAMMGYVQLLRMHVDGGEVPDPAKLTEYVAMMEESGYHMDSLVNNILSLDRIEQQAAEMMTYPFDLTRLVQDTFKINQPQARLNGQRLTCSIPDITLIAEGDEIQIGEALGNLVSNALKYTAAEGEIHIALHANGDEASITVTDSGRGIKPADIPNLFKPFFRAQDASAEGIDGTGLGLYLVKNIVERHGGYIHTESVYGQGSTFTITLPLQTEPA